MKFEFCPDKVRLRLVTHVFLLSPAWCGGKRAKMLLNPAASFDLAVRLRRGTLSLGEAFAFMSGLYFRGKLAYGSRFGRYGGRDRTFVITPTQGLQSPWSRHGGSAPRVRVSGHERGRSALPRAARTRSQVLDASLEPDARVVLLGSIATSKDVDALCAWSGRVSVSRRHSSVAAT